MATNKLMEAAADILAGSKKSASAAPMQKPEDAGVVDLGGPSQKPGEHHVGEDPYAGYKIDGAKAAKSATAPTTKPSNASPDDQNKPVGGKKTMGEEEEVSDDETLIDEKSHEMEKNMKKKMKEDIDALFADDSTISEDFKSKASTIFEARVMDRVAQIQEELDQKYAAMFEETVQEISQDLTNKVDDYLNYVVEQWIEQNEIAIESGLRSELTEEFIAGLRNLFAEHYIDVPAEKVDLVDELAGKVEELEGKLNEEIERGMSFKKALVESRKAEITREVTEGLTATQVEKIKSLAESVEFSTEEEYQQKLETIRENYFPSGVKKANEEQLHEKVEDAGEQKVISDPFVAAVSQAISKTKL
jgi:hypothetical protein